jgi:putative (di)nucleoside polyphosphate hydrolase
MKLISAGTIIHDNNSLLVCHVTDKPYWDIPKGLIENNEDPLDAAMRELYEETGIDNRDLKNYKVKILGLVPYLNNKDLYLFDITLTDNYPDTNEMICKSTFHYDYDFVEYPEVDCFKYIERRYIDKYLIPKMCKAIYNFYPFSF